MSTDQSFEPLSIQDQHLLELLNHSELVTVPDVIRLMQDSLRLLPEHDGIHCFLSVYLAVTEAVHADLERGRWRSPEWMVALDVEFAKLFFNALQAWLKERSTCPPAWRPLFEHRARQSVLPVQFVMAGLTAHINRDLPLAIVFAFAKVHHTTPRSQTLERVDFKRVDHLLNEVEMNELQKLATGWAKRLCDLFPRAAPRAMMVSVSASRRVSWITAKLYAMLYPRRAKSARFFLAVLDRVVEQMARFSLLATD